MSQIIIYRFIHQEVLTADCRHFLNRFGPRRLPRGLPLAAQMNTMTFLLAGFDEDPRELHSIPEVRRFYRTFFEAWPYWFYYCNIDSDTFLIMALCCLPSLRITQVDQKSMVAVEYNHQELLDFLRRGFGPMNALCDRAGMSERQIVERTKAIFGYFNFPFEASEKRR